jgi:hypothetical protein
VEALGDVERIPEARLGSDVQRCPISRGEKRGMTLVTVHQKLDVQRELVGDTKLVSMGCVGIVGLENRAKRVSGFAVQTSDCG